jgi:hypothetical protein
LSVPFRVVVYAEGESELGRAGITRLEAGGELPGDELGSAHVLARRVIALVNAARQPVFVAPLRTRGRHARGSDLIVPRVLGDLTTWPSVATSPNLAIIIVDRDEVLDRRAELRRATEGLITPPLRVVAVAREEFEAWLITDVLALRSVLELDLDQAEDPEQMRSGAAKNLLRDWIGKSSVALDSRDVRTALAGQLRLEFLLRQNRSFQEFVEDLRAACAA